MTPSDYEPEYFKAATTGSDDPNGNLISNMRFSRQPLRVKIGKVETPHHKMELKFAGLESLLDVDDDMVGPINSKLEATSIQNHNNPGTSNIDAAMEPITKANVAETEKPLVAQSFNDSGSIDYNVDSVVADMAVADSNGNGNGNGGGCDHESPNKDLVAQVKDFM